MEPRIHANDACSYQKIRKKTSMAGGATKLHTPLMVPAGPQLRIRVLKEGDVRL